MKRSEFELKRLEHWQRKAMIAQEFPDTLVRRDVCAAEAAGVVWEPEEEPLAERLVVDGHQTWATLHAEVTGSSFCSSRLLTPREAAEVRRRYNAWPELREHAETLFRAHGPDLDDSPMGRLIGVLRGER